VERTHPWFDRCRKLLIRWEKKPENYLALVQFAATIAVKNVDPVVKLGHVDHAHAVLSLSMNPYFLNAGPYRQHRLAICGVVALLDPVDLVACSPRRLLPTC